MRRRIAGFFLSGVGSADGGGREACPSPPHTHARTYVTDAQRRHPASHPTERHSRRSEGPPRSGRARGRVPMTPQANGGGSADDGDGDRDGVRGAVSRGVGIGGGFTLKVDRATRQLDGRTLFSGCSFGLAPREILFISGPSGVGKTLLLRSIACLDDLQVGACARVGVGDNWEGICGRACVPALLQA
eukprot:363324-Chlamydomonas_euryale.AAC.25